jgi:hypothetical protein
MNNDVTKTLKGPAPAAPTQDAASQLKQGLMADALDRMFGKETEKPIAPGTPRVLLALANHGHSPGWERAKVLQRQMFDAAGHGLEMKFAFYAEDDEKGVRRCRITSRSQRTSTGRQGKYGPADARGGRCRRCLPR